MRPTNFLSLKGGIRGSDGRAPFFVPGCHQCVRLAGVADGSSALTAAMRSNEKGSVTRRVNPPQATRLFRSKRREQRFTKLAQRRDSHNEAAPTTKKISNRRRGRVVAGVTRKGSSWWADAARSEQSAVEGCVVVLLDVLGVYRQNSEVRSSTTSLDPRCSERLMRALKTLTATRSERVEPKVSVQRWAGSFLVELAV